MLWISSTFTPRYYEHLANNSLNCLFSFPTFSLVLNMKTSAVIQNTNDTETN